MANNGTKIIIGLLICQLVVTIAGIWFFATQFGQWGLEKNRASSAISYTQLNYDTEQYIRDTRDATQEIGSIMSSIDSSLGKIIGRLEGIQSSLYDIEDILKY